MSLPEARSSRVRPRVQQRTLRGWCEEYEKMEAREQELEAKISAMDQHHQQQMQRKDEQMRERQNEFDSLLAARAAESTAAAQAHFDRSAELESELHGARAHSAQVERSLADLAARYKTVTDKLKRAGDEYAKNLAYGETMAQENAALRADLQTAKTALHAVETVAKASQDEAREREQQLQLRLEDAYSKLLLLNRTVQSTTEASQHQEQRADDLQRRVDEGNRELAGAREEHTRATTLLQRAESELVSLHHRQAEVTRDRDHLQQQLQQAAGELQAMASERDQLRRHHQETRTQMETLAHQHRQVQRQHADVSTQLETALNELKQHHQLAAMIHKLSGQASTAIAAS